MTSEAQAEGRVAGTTGETGRDANRDPSRRTAGQMGSDDSRQSVAASPGDRIFDASRDSIVSSAGGRSRRKLAPETPLGRGLSSDESWSRPLVDPEDAIAGEKSEVVPLAPPEGLADDASRRLDRWHRRRAWQPIELRGNQ